MPNPNILLLLSLFLPLIFSSYYDFVRLANAGKRSIHITDDLDDFDPPPSDLNKMNMQEIQEMMTTRNFGPVFGFVKLRLGERRTPDAVAEIAMKWTKIMKTGGIRVQFTGVDSLKEFILKEPEAYEIKIGDQVFRRPGDPPLEAVIEKLLREKDKADDTPEDDGRQKEEL
ncbi:Mesd domain-containing protein [Salix suchowensis]|nr:Mesd domain-containing protein [Salix suchowensis]